jgi:hypothetical protein
MNFLDYIVFLIYVFIFYLIFAWRRKKISDPRLKRYHKFGFWVKVFSCFAYCMFILKAEGDTTALYHPEGYNIYKLILKDPSNINLLFISAKEYDEALLANILNLGYFREESNFLVTRIVALLSFFTFGKFLAINLFFSMISFTGVWRLYRFFYEQYPDLHKQFAIGILYLPSFVFWSSGILKDPLCTGALGWITYSLYTIFYTRKKKKLLYAAIALFFAYLLSVLKIYILVSYLPFFVLFMILKNVSLIKNNFSKVTVVLVFLMGSIFGFIRITNTMQEALGDYASKGVKQTIKSYQESYENQGSYATSNFSLGVEFDGSANSLLKMAPAAVVATLFRPFIWESKKASTMLSSLESLAMMMLTLYCLVKVGIKKFILTIVKKPIVLYCFLYSVIFSLFVGATTLNFGSLVRYKIPGLPFYVISMFLILYFNNKLKNKPGLEAGPVVVQGK